ncbi:MAG: PEGA domain-containing protein [Leptospirales bacterium]|nr:PEGA domain-containing protein [Leptospirales bacterium]
MKSWLHIGLTLGIAFASIPASAEKQQIRIVTQPAGATVFVDGIDQGKTPLSIPVTDRSVNVRLAMAGFEEIRFPLRSSGDLEIVLTMAPDVLPNLSRPLPADPTPVPKKRSPYWGAFARSLVIPGWGQYSKKDSSSFWFLTGTLISGLAYMDARESFIRSRKDAIRKYREGDIYSFLQAGLIPTLRARDTAAAQAIGIAYFHQPSGNEKQYTHNCTFISLVNITNGTGQTCRNNRRALQRKNTTGYVFAGLYLWNAFDALLATEKMSFSVGIPEADRGVVVAASLRF